MVTTQQHAYFFGEGRAEGHGGMKKLLGGKGAGLAEMTNLGLPVPPGFTICTEVCMAYLDDGRRELPPALWEEILQYLARLESVMEKRFGDEVNPLLVSVRSGAAHSMPGMMDTVLNLGLNDRTVRGLVRTTQSERFGYDAYRRFIAMFAGVVMGVPREQFELALEKKKAEVGVQQDADLAVTALQDLVEQYKGLVLARTGEEFPTDPFDQLKRSILAVFDSWMGLRAVEYRRIHRLSDRGGTAVNIVAMVFGNRGEDSGTGVVFSRNPTTGVPALYGDFLLNAQGEDVVAGTRTPQPIEKLASVLPKAYRTLITIVGTLERHYRDMLDLEFTIEDGTLYMLQTRVGKRTGLAAVRIVVDLVREGLMTAREAVMRVDANQLAQFFLPCEAFCRELSEGKTERLLFASPSPYEISRVCPNINLNAKGEQKPRDNRSHQQGWADGKVLVLFAIEAVRQADAQLQMQVQAGSDYMKFQRTMELINKFEK